MKTLEKNNIIIASVDDSLASPSLQNIVGHPSYNALIKDPRVLRGLDKVELRVLDVDHQKMTVHVAFHAVDTFNPQVSTGRIIFVTYQSMQNTVYHILNRFLRLR